MTAIGSGVLLNNRRTRRKWKGEATRAMEHLQWIIDDFVDSLFKAPEKFDYRVIYLHFLDLWNETFKVLDKQKFKAITIDRKFFANQFAPTNLQEKKFATRFELIIF